MTHESTTVVLGIPIPSTDPFFLSIVGVHVLFGLAAVTAGARDSAGAALAWMTARFEGAPAPSDCER